MYHLCSSSSGSLPSTSQLLSVRLSTPLQHDLISFEQTFCAGSIHWKDRNQGLGSTSVGMCGALNKTSMAVTISAVLCRVVVIEVSRNPRGDVNAKDVQWTLGLNELPDGCLDAIDGMEGPIECGKGQKAHGSWQTHWSCY